jgi:hypothetical protein
MTVLIAASDLAPFATIDSTKAAAMISDAIGMAVINAPCLATPDNLTANQLAAAKAVLRTAILRWNDAGSGAVETQSMLGMSVTLDTKQHRRSMFWPSEIEDLQRICKAGTIDGGAFSINTATAEPIRFHASLGWPTFDCGPTS